MGSSRAAKWLIGRIRPVMVLILAAGVLLLVAARLGKGSVTQAAQSPNEKDTPPARPAVALPTLIAAPPPAGVRRRAQTYTEIPERPRMTALQYTVQSGDTPWSIAQKFGLRPESILWANEGLSAEAGKLAIGRQLVIPPVDGVVHVVHDGDTLERLQALHGTSVEEIIEFPGNDFDPLELPALEAGRSVIIPHGRSAVAWQEPGPRVVPGLGRRSPGLYSGPLVYIGSGYFRWPVSPVRITQSYWSGHPAIDIDTYNRQPVFASDSGTVIFSDWDTTGYGNLIIVDHGNGYWTYYGHNEANLVSVGEGVHQGQQIAESGSTGNSTGDHVDFRIRQEGVGFLDPQDFLP